MGGSLIVISGPSGVGKGTVVKRLLAEMPDLYISVSVTTRKPRPGEIPGKDYIFIDDKQFEEMVVNNQLLEWAYVHGHYYGTPKRQVFDKLAEGKTVILEIDMQGAMQVQRSVDDVVLIFLLPPSIKELANRLDKRGTEDEEIRKLTADILMSGYKLSKIYSNFNIYTLSEEERLYNTVISTIILLKIKILETERELLKKELKEAEAKKDETKMLDLIQRISRINNAILSFKKEL